jgi:hypothetical protein
MNATQATRPVLDSRAKPGTLAETVAKTKGLKQPAAVAAKPQAVKPAAPKAPAKPAAPKADAEAIATAKAKQAADKAEAKAAADKVKAEAKAAKDAEKAAAKEAKEKAAAAAKEAKAKAREEAKAARIAAGVPDRLVPADLTHYHVDKEKKTAGGHASVDSDDKLAQELRGFTIDQVYTKAALVLGEAEKDLKAKYAHLNVGMQRMNLGNRMRAAVMKVNAPAKATPAKPVVPAKVAAPAAKATPAKKPAAAVKK